MRSEYSLGGLDENDLEPEPFSMLRRWLDDATAASLPEPNAMVLSTVSEDGQPSSRMVLLKGIDEWGFAFYTNLLSRKGVELAANPACSLLFQWHPLERQVRIEGVASQLLREDVALYFSARPRGAQLSAWASHQSSQVAQRSGYVVRPTMVEFWQGRRDRLHDRLVYRRTDDADVWTIERLAP